MKKDNNFIGLALPFHGNDRATQHQSLQRESSRDDGEFFLPKPMTDLTPATPTNPKTCANDPIMAAITPAAVLPASVISS